MQELSVTIKRPNARIMGVPEAIEREAGLKDVFDEIITQNFGNTEKERGNQRQKGQRSPNRLDQK